MGGILPSSKSSIWLPIVVSAAVLAITAALFVWGAFAFGAPLAWELLAGIESPANHEELPGLCWTISVLGYIIVPALIGLMTGIGAEIMIQSRSLTAAELLNIAAAELLQPPPAPPAPPVPPVLPSGGTGP